MAKCVLHVGMHKTGTASIQHSLKDLDDGKFYYARIQTMPNHSVTIASIFHVEDSAKTARKHARGGKMSATERAGLARPDLDRSVAVANGRTLVMSGEGITHMSEEELVSLKSYLAGHGYDDIEVVAYVRPPIAYISGVMSNKLKSGKMRKLRIQTCFPNYRDKFEKFDDVFGAENVRLFKYDPASFPDGDVVADFCQRMGIPLSSVTVTRMNVKITRLIAMLNFQYAVHAEAEGLRPLRGANSRRFLDRLRNLDSARFQLAPSIIAPFLRKIQRDVNWMEKRLGQSLAESGLRDQDGDIRSEEDLLAPVAGINEKLHGLLTEAGVDVQAADAGNTWKLLAQVANMGLPGSSGNIAGTKTGRMNKRRPARLPRGDAKGEGSADQRALQRARRAGRTNPARNPIGAAADVHGAGRVAAGQEAKPGQGRRVGQGAARGGGAPSREERQRKRDERIMAMAQAIAAASVANAAPLAAQPAQGRPGLGGGAGGNRQGQGMGRGPGMGVGARRPGPGNRQGQGPRAGHTGRTGPTGQGMTPGVSQGLPHGNQMPGGQRGAGAGHKGKGPGRKTGGSQLKPPKEVLQLPRANARPDAPPGPRRQPLTPITTAPMPLINIDKNLAVLWSPKSACTTVYVWFSHVSGFSEDVKDYSSWPHRHRQEQYMKSDLYNDSASNGMGEAKLLRVIRDPYGRAVSIYRHALQTRFADQNMDIYSDGTISAEQGYSFQTFLDMVATLDMRHVDIHFRPQFHFYETQRKPDRVINISKQDLFTELNAFEAETGIPKTNFSDLDWLHDLESKRKAKQEPMEGDTLDTQAFSRLQVGKLGLFPNYGQLLTPQARQKIEAIYKSDFDAYRDFL